MEAEPTLFAKLGKKYGNPCTAQKEKQTYTRTTLSQSTTLLQNPSNSNGYSTSRSDKDEKYNDIQNRKTLILVESK